MTGIWMVKKYLFWVLLFVCIFSFINRDSYRNVNDIAPELLKAPVLNEIANKYPIEISNNRYLFKLTPVYECRIAGLIVDTSLISFMMHRWCTSIEKEKVLDMDRSFNIIWGDNVGKKIYKNKSINFSEGSYTYGPNTTAPNENEFDSISLITKNTNLWNSIKSLRLGDQIEIRGKIVNVAADAKIWKSHLEYTSGKPGISGQNLFCVIYVDDLKVLKKASSFYNYLFWISLLGLIALIIFRIIDICKIKDLING